MVKAFIFIRAYPNKIDKVSLSIARLEGVKEVYVITGEYDILVKVEAKDFLEVSRLVRERVLPIDGIVHTTTSMVFEDYSPR